MQSSIPEIAPIAPARDMTVYPAGRAPTAVTLEGETVPFTVCDGRAAFTVPANLLKKQDLVYSIVY